jgi:hypothetical protein
MFEMVLRECIRRIQKDLEVYVTTGVRSHGGDTVRNLNLRNFSVRNEPSLTKISLCPVLQTADSTILLDTKVCCPGFAVLARRRSQQRMNLSV